MNSEKISFAKYQATGNDFIIINTDENDFPGIDPVKLCHRNFGIGADGILLLSRSENQFQMKIINSDGSIAEMCGNGIRCFAQYLKDKKLITDEIVSIKTDAGVKVCKFNSDGTITVNLGSPLYINVSEKPVLAVDKKFNFFEVSVGNPHAVIFSENPEFDAKKYGELISENRSIFKNRTNVEFIKVDKESMSVDAVIFERGCGITMSCGTGASAIGGVLTEKGIFPKDSWITINLPGGKLYVKRDGKTDEIFLKGPASFTFEGVFYKSSFINR